MTLKIYNKKRDFSKTSEPKGKVNKKTSKKKLFLIQKHAASHLHYDFRLELNGVLLSWAVPKGPSFDPSIKRLAMQTEDHPLAYGSFEGTIPKGEYGGGTVMLWDTGEWISEDENPTAAYRKGHLRFTLKAKKLKGSWNLIRFKTDEKKAAWFLIKSKDKFAKKNFDVTVKEPNSAVSGLSMEEIAENSENTWTSKKLKKSSPKKAAIKKVIPKKKLQVKTSAMPRAVTPQLCTLVASPPEGAGWLHEIKLDGYRMLTFINDKKIKLISRNKKDWTSKFENVVTVLKKLSSKNLILDGEIVLLDKDSKSNFQLLQNSLSVENTKKPSYVYYVFDILYYDQYNLKPLPLVERKELLKKLLLKLKNKTIRYSEHIEGSGDKIFKKSCQLGLEGIICKDATSPYIELRSKSWLKVKCIKRQELIICGYTKPQGSRMHFGALLLGFYNQNHELTYCGNVGTGFTQKSLKDIYTLFQKNISKTNPFSTNPPGYKSAVWLKPNIVCEVEFTEWTNEGSLRHPSFKGLRFDKKASKIIKETASQVHDKRSKKTSK
jgi:bifunctional non-homologous end joining protein LigD